jgi:eukaryotic translation initiation factor 2-alpha kinase 4
MLAQSKKNGTVSCATLLVELSDDFAARNSKALVSRSPGIPIPNASTTSLTGPKTPMPPYSSPPDRDYFQLSSIFRGRATHSRWKEDWEELELLGRGAFGSVVKARNKIDHRIYAGAFLPFVTSAVD